MRWSSASSSPTSCSPGSGLSISTEGLKAKDVTPPSLVSVLLNIVPINPMDALSKGNMLQIIFFALLFGFGLSTMGKRASPSSTSSTARRTS
ncbi:MAG: cation:dicarboxylase symporter family transporter [Bilophila sp.]